MTSAGEFQYRVPWRAVSSYPGSHPSLQRGGGYELHGTLPFYAGDPRRLDLRASLRDPYGQLLVRVFKQRSMISVFALVDVSASLGFVGATSKFGLLNEFVESLALSASRVGDPFGLIACDAKVRDELTAPPSRAAGAGRHAARMLRRWTPRGANTEGLLAGAERMPGGPALVFLVSDFHLPLSLLRRVLDRLGGHAVVPVVLVDSAETRAPGAGITHLYDAETGATRTILVRRAWAARFDDALREHRERLRHCLAEHDTRPLYIVDRFEPEAVSRYFYE